MLSATKPPKRWPFGDQDEPEFKLLDGCAVCENCGGDGGGDYPARWSFDRNEPDFDWAECSTCEGTGQVRLDGESHEQPKPRSQDCDEFDLGEEIPF